MSAKIEHIAIIMDGNGRWAQMRSRPRIWGHVRGVSVVSEIVESAANTEGIKSLTLYAFSTENWSRPAAEVKSLFFLLKKYLIKERAKIIRNCVKFKVVGNIEKLPEGTQRLIRELELETAGFLEPKLKLNFAFDYGGREEIVRAVNHILKKQYFSQTPVLPPVLSEEEISSALDTVVLSEVKDIDLMIRTGGEQRISNFLLWQSAYAELYFVNTLWPDFTVEEFQRVYQEVSQRKRRFGGVEEGGNLIKNILKARDVRANVNYLIS